MHIFGFFYSKNILPYTAFFLCQIHLGISKDYRTQLANILLTQSHKKRLSSVKDVTITIVKNLDLPHFLHSMLTILHSSNLRAA